MRQLDENKLIADENLSLNEGAIASWRLPGRNFMPSVAEQAGIRVDVPFKELTAKEKTFVLNGPQKKFKMDFAQVRDVFSMTLMSCTKMPTSSCF